MTATGSTPGSGTAALEPLAHRVHFVFKERKRWPELFGVDDPPPVEACAHKFMGAKNSWGIQTYLQLRHRGLDVELVDRYVPGAICVTTYEHLRIIDRPFNSYVVACRHDRGRPEICEQRVVQNLDNVVDDTDHYVPHWPQPGLVPRDRQRRSTVANVVYQGRPAHLAPEYRDDGFTAALAGLGLRLRLGEADGAREVASWTDYSTADVVLAVRRVDPYTLGLKPPSKLLNAWLAGCPALLGPEPAYRQLRRSELDYVEVSSPAEAIEALRRLRDDPGRYAAMVRNGDERAREYTPDRIAEVWRDLLAGPVSAGFERWRDAGPLERTIGRAARFAWRTRAHRREAAIYERHRPGPDRAGN